jgi:HK97 family phage major capsid protein
MKEIKEALESFKSEMISKIAESKTLTAEEKNARHQEITEIVASEISKHTEQNRFSLPGSECEKDFSWLELIKAQDNKGVWGNSKSANVTKEMVEAIHKANNTESGANGGYLVPTEKSNEIIQLAIASMPVMDFGPTVLSGLTGNLDIPKVTGRSTGYWVGETEAPTESSPTFGQIELRPKTVAGFTKQSRLLLTQAGSVAETLIKNSLAEGIALKWHEAIIAGTGTNSQPRGIVNYSGLTSSSTLEATDGIRFKVDKAAGMMTRVDVANLLKPNSKKGFLMRPEVLSGMKRERVIQFSGQPQADGMPVINPLIKNATLEDILEAKIRTTTLLSGTLTKGSNNFCSQVIFGDWSQLVLAMWNGFEVVTSNTAGDSTGSAMRNRQIWITAFQNVDVNIKDEGAFTVVADARVRESDW